MLSSTNSHQKTQLNFSYSSTQNNYKPEIQITPRLAPQKERSFSLIPPSSTNIFTQVNTKSLVSSSSQIGTQKKSKQFKPIRLPQIDLSRNSADFAVPTLNTLKNEWFHATVKPQANKSQVIVRRKSHSLICSEKEAALRAARMRLERAKYRELWHRAFRKIVNERRRSKQRIYNYWKNASEQLLKMHFRRKESQVNDRFSLLCGEFERLMNVDDWRQIRRKEYNLDRMMKSIDNRHKQRVMDQFREVLVSTKHRKVSLPFRVYCFAAPPPFLALNSSLSLPVQMLLVRVTVKTEDR